MGDTTISWTNKTWNYITGCSHVSDGCRNCYAERMYRRFHKGALPWTAENADANIQVHPDRLEQPFHWGKPSMVFVNSMSDLFHDLVPVTAIVNTFAVMATAQEHTYQILTKRPRRMLEILSDRGFPEIVDEIMGRRAADRGWCCDEIEQWPLPNVWLGVSVENQRMADERIPLLLQTPAAVRFLSCEPLLSPIDLDRSVVGCLTGICGHPCASYMAGDLSNCECAQGKPPHSKIDWVIVGGESGPGYRPMDLDWARSIRDQCIAATAPFFFKQESGPRPGMHATLDGRGWKEFPR